MPALQLTALLIFLISFPRPSTPDWTSECISRYPASCRCTWSSGKRLADCSKSNMNALPILSNDIQILDMSNNKLTQLHDNGFTNANLINLQKLYLKGCRISKLHELAFFNLRILTELDLSHNEIEFVDPIMFSTNVRLSKVRLNNNKIHSVREFPKLDYLNTLDFSYNMLTNLSYHTFSALRNLKDLDLSYNLFTNLNPEMFSGLSSLKLRGNNWVCDCELKALRDYVVVNKFYEQELRCTEPLSLFNSQWDGFDELSCKPEILHILANGRIVDSIVALENTLVLSCVVKGDPLPDVKWVKNGRVVQEAQRGVDNVRGGGVVMLNLTVGRHDNEFVCVGSNSGGVVERNLTVTLDEAGLSGFVVLKDGVDGNLGGGTGTSKDRNGLLIYLVIGIVFLSLIIGLVIGGVCVWRWGQRGGRPVVEQDSVVKGVLKDDTATEANGDGDNDHREMQVQREFLVDQTISPNSQQQQPQPPPSYYNDNNHPPPPHHQYYNNRYYNNRADYTYRYFDYDDTHAPTATLTLRSKVHPNEILYDTVVYSRVHNNQMSPDICDLIPPPPPPVVPEGFNAPPPPPMDCECGTNVNENIGRLLDFRNRSRKPHSSAEDILQRPTPDLLINNGANSPELEELYDKFPIQTNDSSSLYDNYELCYKPLLLGTERPDSLRRYCLGKELLPAPRPSSVCSEPRGSLFGQKVGSPVILSSHHYVTLPRRSMHKKKEDVPIKYDNLGPRTTADGSSYLSLTDVGSEAAPLAGPHLFEPIIEQPLAEDTLKKYRPVPPPKPKKKVLPPESTSDSLPLNNDDDDGTEV